MSATRESDSKSMIADMPSYSWRLTAQINMTLRHGTASGGTLQIKSRNGEIPTH